MASPRPSESWLSENAHAGCLPVLPVILAIFAIAVAILGG